MSRELSLRGSQVLPLQRLASQKSAGWTTDWRPRRAYIPVLG